MRHLRTFAYSLTILAFATVVAQAALNPEGAEKTVPIFYPADIAGGIAETVATYIDGFKTDKAHVFYASGDSNFLIQLANGQTFLVQIAERTTD